MECPAGVDGTLGVPSQAWVELSRGDPAVEAMVAAWKARGVAQASEQANRQFLAALVVLMVQGFRDEEAWLVKTASTRLESCRAGNRRIARLAHELLVECEWGVDLTGRIHGLITAWQDLQGRKGVRCVPEPRSGH